MPWAAGQLPAFLRSVLRSNWVTAVCFRWWWAVQSLPGRKHWIRGRHRAAQQFLPSQPRWESIYTPWYGEKLTLDADGLKGKLQFFWK